MPRPIWSGAISFGLVNVGVTLHSATSSKKVRFHELAPDGSRVRHPRVSEGSGEELEADQIRKGYEISPDSYVVIETGELDALDPAASRTIEVLDFVELSEIDPVYFQRAYYVAPGKSGSERAYSLLARAMSEANKVAVTRFVMRGTEYLAALRAREGVLILEVLWHADEVIDPSSVIDDTGAELPARELEMAHRLIDSLTVPFEPARYPDSHRQRVLELIEARANGQEIAAAPEVHRAPVIDLLAALEESVAAAKTRHPSRTRRTADATEEDATEEVADERPAKRRSRSA